MIITAGKFKGLKIEAPNEKITRPTLSKVRMAVFNTLHAMTNFEGKSFLDMYAGSGIIGLEAYSRGFGEIVEMESDSKVFSVLKKNYSKFERDNIRLYKGDSLKCVSKLKKIFDVIYIDPPYFSGIYEDSLSAVQDYVSEFVILEHVTDINIEGFELIKQKRYGKKKLVSFLKPRKALI